MANRNNQETYAQIIHLLDELSTYYEVEVNNTYVANIISDIMVAIEQLE